MSTGIKNSIAQVDDIINRDAVVQMYHTRMKRGLLDYHKTHMTESKQYEVRATNHQMETLMDFADARELREKSAALELAGNPMRQIFAREACQEMRRLFQRDLEFLVQDPDKLPGHMVRIEPTPSAVTMFIGMQETALQAVSEKITTKDRVSQPGRFA